MVENKDKNSLQEYVESLDLFTDWELDNQKEPQPYLWKDMDSLVFPNDRWLVQNLFPKEGTTIFASISGEGKSLLIMHLAKCISEGKPWFGHDGFRTQKARVLYINLEMSLSEMQRRGRMIDFDSKNEDLVILNEDSFNLNEGIGEEDLKYKWLLKYVHDQKIKVIIIDTFRAASGGLKEEKAEEIRKFFQKFLILKNSGISLVFLEHVRKPTQTEGKVPKKEQLLGSQDKTANAEVLLMIRRDEASGNINIYQRKNRLGNELKPFAVKLIDIGEPNDPEKKLLFEYVGEIDDAINKKEEAKELVLNILADGEMKNYEDLGKLTNKQVGGKNLRAALKELRDGGEVDFIKEGRRHCYFLPQEKDKNQEESMLDDESKLFSDSS